MLAFNNPKLVLLSALVFSITLVVTTLGYAAGTGRATPTSAGPDKAVVNLAFLPSTIFTDVTAMVGISATHHLQYDATGQAWGDYNNDGRIDLYLTDNRGPNKLYENNGDGTFRLSPLSGDVALPESISGGALFGDYDNDGWLDLYVLNQGPNVLFHNNAGAGFQDVTAQAGVGDIGQGQTGAWGDFDNDGFIDLFVTNWYYHEDETSELSSDRLYKNNGNGSFTEITAALSERTRGPGFVGTFLDFDNDGDLDIYVVNDKFYGNLLWRNDGPGCLFWCFTDISASAGADTKVWGMGLAVGDYDNDKDLDLYFSNGGPAVLLQNQTSQGSPTFIDVSSSAGVNPDLFGWGAVFFDFDNDGWLDLYLATIHPEPGRANRLFHNQSDGTFADVSAGSGVSDPGFSLGVAYADYDADGWLDLLVGNWGEEYRLYRNQAGDTAPANHWLRVELKGAGSVNRDAIGSRAYITTTDGHSSMQEVKSGSSLGSGNETTLHFGLGPSAAQKITIVWPDGRIEHFTEPVQDQVWQLRYPLAGMELTGGYRLHIQGGQVLTISHNLQNTGTRTDTYTVTAAGPPGWIQPGALDLTLDPNEVGEVLLRVDVPAVFASESLTLTVTSSNDPTYSRSVVHDILVSNHLLNLPLVSR